MCVHLNLSGSQAEVIHLRWKSSLRSVVQKFLEWNVFLKAASAFFFSLFFFGNSKTNYEPSVVSFVLQNVLSHFRKHGSTYDWKACLFFFPSFFIRLILYITMEDLTPSLFLFWYHIVSCTILPYHCLFCPLTKQCSLDLDHWNSIIHQRRLLEGEEEKKIDL